jgi:hypothetical protein
VGIDCSEEYAGSFLSVEVCGVKNCFAYVRQVLLSSYVDP